MQHNMLVRLAVRMLGCGLAAVLAASLTARTAAAEEATKTPTGQLAQAGQPAVREHPLAPAMRMAKSGLELIDKDIKDYSCTLVKREQVDGKLGDYEYIYLKVRHNPFSVYMYFVSPRNIKGRECIFVAGANDGKLIAHEGGPKLVTLLPTVKIEPTSLIAMRGQRYPITEVGIRNLTAKLVEVAESDLKYGECEVHVNKDAKVNGRSCTNLQVVHPVRRDNFRYHIAQVFIDDQMQVPIRFASYDWPTKEGETPELLEEYTYLNMKVNNGFTDADFDENNGDYKFHNK